MSIDAPSWSVVATVDEPLVLVQAFVAWHLSEGAAEVILYFDRPDDPAAAVLEMVPQVRVIRCGADYWGARHGGRPAKHEVRQIHNATHAYLDCGADWLLHCDADEYLWPHVPIAAALAAVDPLADAAIVPVAERVYLPDTAGGSIFNGAFRRPFVGSAVAGAALFGNGYAMTHRGLTGHAQGKAISRIGRGLKLSIHRPRPHDALRMETLSGAELLHFDGLTRAQWIFKLLRKADHFAHRGGMEPSPHRQRQIDAIRANPDAASALHDKLKSVSGARVAALRANGLLLEANLDSGKALAGYFGTVDTSPTAFDDALLCGPAAAYPFLHNALRA